MRRVSRCDASRQTVAYKCESLCDAQYHKPPVNSEQGSRSLYPPYQPVLRSFQRLEIHAKEVRPWACSSRQTSFAKYTKARPKLQNAKAILYTDGSATRTEEDGTIIGSGAYRQLDNVQLRIALCGIGPTNTVMRAELDAIHAVLLHPSNSSKKCNIDE